MADLTLSSPLATRTMVLATTTYTLSIPTEYAGQMSGVYLYCASECRYQVLDDGRAVVSGSVAPTADVGVVPAAVFVPVPIPAHVSGYAGDRYDIAVWAVAGTPTLHVSPYPVTR